MAKKKAKKLNTRKTVITVVAVYVICNLIYGATNIVDLKMQQSQLSSELDAAYTEQVELQAELEYMNSDDAVEKIAREKLGLVREDEILIRHIDTDSAQ